MSTQVHGEREPLVRIAKRAGITTKKAWMVRGIALGSALIVCALLIYMLTKLNPLKVYSSMFEGALGTKRRTWVTLRDTMMLLCISIGLAPAFKMRFWNIGAEGQVLIGGVATAACMIYLGGKVPTIVLFLAMVIASVVSGAVWGLIPAIFKAKWNTNETLFTLMMNYVAIQITSYCVALWENPFGSNSVGVIHPNTEWGWFPKLFGQQYMLNVIIVMALTVAMYIYLKYTKHGYEIAVVGESENTARYAGINVKKVILRTMVISSGICGLSGFIAVSGASHTISVNTADGRGFTAIIVAWLSKFNAVVMVLFSFLLVFLDKGAVEIASKYQLNEYASEIIESIILFFILGSEFFINYRLVFRRSNKKAEKEVA
jgi:simple sugar transport system permease protein